jgi:N6-adenosine-specific RNA methylase IME4
VKYHTIVADPPWHYDSWPGPMTKAMPGTTAAFDVSLGRRRKKLDYPSLTVAQIAALPVADLADPSGCHLYLWTTNRYLQDALGMIKGWGFRYSQLLVWAKTPMGQGPGGTFAQNAEFVLFCRRGTLKHKRRVDSVWFNWPRTTVHSKKPEHFLDLVETVSPGPYLEMFSRRHRLGWSVWGDQVNASIDLPRGAA